MTHDYKRITQQFGVCYLFTFLDFVLKALLIVLLTRALSVKLYGIYSIFSATIAVLSAILLFGTNYFILTKLPSFKYFKKIKTMVSIIFFLSILLIIILAIISIPQIQKNVTSLLKLEGYTFEFQLSLIIIFFGVIFPLIFTYLLANMKIEFSSFISFLYGCLWIIFIFIFFLIFKKINLTIVFFMWLIGILVSLIIVLFYLRKDIFFYFNKVKKLSFDIFKNAFSFGLPLVPVTMSLWIITVADRYMINYFKNSTLTGIYSLSYSLVMIIYALSAIISQVLYPYVAKAWGEKKNHQILFNAMLKYNLIIIFPGMVGLFVLREQIITLISGTDYLLGSSVIVILIAFPFFASLIQIYNNNLLLREKTKLIMLIYLGGAILNIVLNLFLIPPYGINGAAISTIIAYIFMFLIFFISSKNHLSWNFDFLRIKRIVLASLLMGFVLRLINPQMYLSKILTIISGALIYLILLLLFKVFIKEEYKIIRRFLPRVFKNSSSIK